MKLINKIGALHAGRAQRGESPSGDWLWFDCPPVQLVAALFRFSGQMSHMARDWLASKDNPLAIEIPLGWLLFWRRAQPSKSIPTCRWCWQALASSWLRLCINLSARLIQNQSITCPLIGRTLAVFFSSPAALIPPSLSSYLSGATLPRLSEKPGQGEATSE